MTGETNLAIAFMNKVLLDHCHTHSFMFHLWPSSCFKTQLSDRNKDHMACKTYDTYHLALHRKSLTTSILETDLLSHLPLHQASFSEM